MKNKEIPTQKQISSVINELNYWSTNDLIEYIIENMGDEKIIEFAENISDLAENNPE